MDYARALGRADFIGAIDNEALDFDQLESFVHVTSNVNSNGNNSNCGTTAITIALTAVTTVTTPSHTPLITTSTSPSTNIHPHGGTPSHLPESPPDSGSEPPYSPTDLHGISNLNQLSYPTHSQTPPHHHQQQQQQQQQQQHNQLLMRHQQQVMRDITDTTGNMNCNGCHSGNLVNGNGGNIIHKTEDIMLSSTISAAVPINNSNMNLSSTDMMLQQTGSTLLDLGAHHHMNQTQNGYRNDSHSLLSLPTSGPDHLSTDELNCLMSDVMFHANHNQQSVAPQQQTIPRSQQHVVSQKASTTPIINSPSDIQHLLNSRKRNMPTTQSHHSDFNSISIISSNEQTNGLPIKRSQSVALAPVIKPEPDTLSPSCVSALVEPMSPTNSIVIDNCAIGNGINLVNCDALNGKPNLQHISLMVDTCSNISSSCSTSSSPPISTSIIVESKSSQQNQQQQNSDGSCADSCPLQCIRFSPFQQQTWHILCDQSLQELPMPHYRVDADKGFNFSNSDDAFVCQKKNHFQITCHAQLQGDAAIFVRTESGLEKIKSFHLHFYGVKLEAPTQTIRVEQSQSDRSKKPFHPVPIDLQNRQVSKVTVGRLHFSETTSNNMRKKGRPNPEQRYFQLVVGLHAHTHSGNFPVISHGSERIIVRASNPGQFESDVELCWQRGVTQDSIFHAGRVGINTDRPDESLVVHGNLKISGHIVQPSDSRAKQEISELDTSQQLQNVKRIRVVKYRYEPEFAIHSGLAAMPNIHSNKLDKNSKDRFKGIVDVIDTGVIAQEIREVLPDAVQEAGSILLPNGDVIDNFLLVNKDRIYMENIGAVKELCKVTGSLETRIEHLERMNSRFIQIRKADEFNNDNTTEWCSNKMIYTAIAVLILIMALCLVGILALYFVEHRPPYDTISFKDELQSHIPDFSTFLSNNRRSNIYQAQDNQRLTHGNNKVYYSAFTQQQDQERKNFPSKVQLNSNVFVKNASMKTMYNNTVETTTKSFTIDDLEKPHEYEPNIYVAASNNSNDLKEIKGTQINNNKQSDSLKIEQQNAENNVDNVPLSPESHINWTNNANNAIPENLLAEVDTNFIDTGQLNIRNGSKLDDKNLVKNHKDDIELQNIHNINDHIIYESEYHRERTIEPPIGTPSHCFIQNVPTLLSLPKNGTEMESSTTIASSTTNSRILSVQSLPVIDSESQCPSACDKDSVLNQAQEMIEAPELSIPENIDLVESSTIAKSSTTKLDTIDNTNPIAPPSVLNNQINKTMNIQHLIVVMPQFISPESTTTTTTTMKTTIDKSNKIVAIHAKRPIEIKDSPMSRIFDSGISMIVNDFRSISTDLQTKQNSVDPSLASLDSHSASLLTEATAPISAANNDIDNVYNKKIKSLHFENIANEVNKSASIAVVPAEVTASGCINVQLMARTDAFNVTLGSDEICPQSDGGGHNFNITYNMPISKYMKENRFKLIFITSIPLQWRLCSTKQRTGKDHHIQADNYNITEDNISIEPNDITTKFMFDIYIPVFGYFERQMEFKATIGSADMNTCRIPTSITPNMNSVQLILYKINIYRDCN